MSVLSKSLIQHRLKLQIDDPQSFVVTPEEYTTSTRT